MTLNILTCHRGRACLVLIWLALFVLGCEETVPPAPVVADLDGDGFDADVDCDEDDPMIYPGAPERCNGLDDNCDGLIEEGWDEDGDGDGYPPCIDCDDDDYTINPGAVELCTDDVDEDCDGDPLPADAVAGFIDEDGDGFGWGDPIWYVGDDVPAGTVTDGSDCDDTDSAVFPDAEEVCDGRDNDCDYRVDEDFDLDLDLFTSCGPDGEPGTSDDDHDDADPQLNPQAPELCDGVDNDGDGLVDYEDPDYAGADADRDGYVAVACGGQDCDDSDWRINPGQLEACDGRDNDCDGQIDEAEDLDPDWDRDGYYSEGCGQLRVELPDCDDTDRRVYPVAQETSGVLLDCLPLVRPGQAFEPNYGMDLQPFVLDDPRLDTIFVYSRGHFDRDKQVLVVRELGEDGATLLGSKVVLEPGEPGAWDDTGLSDPTVVVVPGLERPFVMLYQGQSSTDDVRRIGLASARDPAGPFERQDPVTGHPLTEPVIQPSSWSWFPDSANISHPSLYYDEHTDLLTVWHSGRATDPETGELGPIAIYQAESVDFGLTWVHLDEDGQAGPDPVFAPQQDWEGDRITQFTPTSDWLVPGTFHTLYKAGAASVGYAHGDGANWTRTQDRPVLTPDMPPSHMAGRSWSGATMYLDLWQYAARFVMGAQSETDPDIFPDPEGAHGPVEAEYIGYLVSGRNLLPTLRVDMPDEPGATTIFRGRVSDSFPTGLVVRGVSDRDGLLGEVHPFEAFTDGVGRQSADWEIVATDMRPGLHHLTFTVTDEAGAQEVVETSILIP